MWNYSRCNFRGFTFIQTILSMRYYNERTILVWDKCKAEIEKQNVLVHHVMYRKITIRWPIHCQSWDKNEWPKNPRFVACHARSWQTKTNGHQRRPRTPKQKNVTQNLHGSTYRNNPARPKSKSDNRRPSHFSRIKLLWRT